MIRTTYGQLASWTGIRSRTTLAGALTELETVGMITRARTSTGGETRAGWATAQTVIKLTWQSPRFQDWLACGYKLPRETYAVERATGLTVHFLDKGGG
jgi:hypothetical protein